MNGELRRRGLTRGDFLRLGGGAVMGASVLGGLAGCGGGSSGGKTELTLWAWLPDFQEQVDMFEKAHPNIKVKLVNAGQGADEYQKLRTALKAGSGAPDVVHMEFQFVPTFRQIEGLADISEYGANDLKGDYAEWTWEQVSDGDAVFAMPWDSGPMGLLYRKDVFDEFGLRVPETWEQFAQQAEKLKQASPETFLADFTPEDGGWITGLMWQAGARPFSVDGTTVSIDLDSPEFRRLSEFWGDLVERDLIATKPGFTNDWYRSFAKGTYATWPTAAWGPVFLEGVAGESKGKWRAAPLPQWESGAQASSNWGGSTLAVTTQSEYPEEAATLAKWLTNAPEPTKLYTTKQFLFPVLNELLESPDFKNLKNDFYGGQAVNSVFVEASNRVDTGFEFSPFQDYVYTQMGEQFGDAAGGSVEFADVPANLQEKVSGFAKQQGFKVQ
ncbi:extracellular solute-binding protein [Rubrobacter tropicus]|uniref:Extracellular solute-binding protein n=1 Tax=Rubrobacter tropicus TaxID=2653851 RepID=A0A6G8QAJ3_9ACTN|nr:sugar ABC transporter substrate-binding protein [Rubrobacter tropicus]QIN83479.1 extracellular solute-binding protein [Rubrobacter tropicus]